MLPMSPLEVRELRELVADHWSGFLAEVFGPSAFALDGQEIQRLVDGGFLDASTAATLDPVADAYLLGFYRDRLTQAGLDVVTTPWAKIRDEIDRHPTPATALEHAAIDRAKMWAGQHCRALGNRLGDQILSDVNREDMPLRQRMIDAIGDETAKAILRRDTARQLRSAIGQRTGDWSRDLDRIAATEIQEAQEQGTADFYESENGPDVLYSKIPNPDACKHCRAAYIDPETDQPRVFRLSDLRANGSNIGRKQRDWLPVVGTMHSWCHCRGVRVPGGWRWVNGELQPAKGAR